MDDRFRTHVTKDLTLDGSFPLSAVTSARLLRVTTPPGSSKDRGKTSCPQQLAQPRTTRDHQQGNGLVASLLASWMGLFRLGVTACRVSSRGGRALPGARGFFLQGRGGQEAGAVCLRSR